jgi:transcriptional regulator with XRE-family HTH domain
VPITKQRLARQLGTRIATLRGKAALTQERCAWESGISKAYLSQIEAGKRLPSLVTLLALAERLDMDLKDFFHFA